jgi:hypothetical protein
MLRKCNDGQAAAFACCCGPRVPIGTSGAGYFWPGETLDFLNQQRRRLDQTKGRNNLPCIIERVLMATKTAEIDSIEIKQTRSTSSASTTTPYPTAVNDVAYGLPIEDRSTKDISLIGHVLLARVPSALEISPAC